MNAVLKIFLSMSFSGGLLILALLLGKRFLKDKISRQWQYYIWLVVVFRLLFPFGPEVNLLGKTYQAVDHAMTEIMPLPPPQPAQNTNGDVPVPAAGPDYNDENADSPAENPVGAGPFQEMEALLINHIWLVWLMSALGLLIRKITIYQGFTQYIKAGLTPVSDIEILDRLSIAAEQLGIKKPIELCVNPLVSSPLLFGFFHPCVVLPGTDISEKDFRYTVLHELIHYRRRDMFYKWLVQITVCLHWYNPLVYVMGREITRACEFSCDEAVLAKMGSGKAEEYGKTLLNAMMAVGKYRENPGTVTLGENKQLLKERLDAVMNFRKKSKAVRFLTGALTLCVISGAAFIGVYPAAAASDQSFTDAPAPGSSSSAPKETGVYGEEYASLAERYYEADSLLLFEITFPRLDEDAQRTWLEKFYADSDFAFFSVAVRGLGINSSLFGDFAEKAYTDEEIACFSVLADCMEEAELELWLNRALEDGKWDFQSMLFDRLGKSGEFDELENEKDREWAAALEAEYRAAGVTMDGRDYYYRGQLVNIFLDIRANKSFYTLNMNPAGTVNIKIIRDADNKITGVSCMTETEVTELLGDMSDE